MNFGFCLTQRILQTLNAQFVHPNVCEKKCKLDSGGTRTYDLLSSAVGYFLVGLGNNHVHSPLRDSHLRHPKHVYIYSLNIGILSIVAPNF